MNVFRGGVVPELRKEAWKYLLGYREWNETTADYEKVLCLVILYIYFCRNV